MISHDEMIQKMHTKITDLRAENARLKGALEEVLHWSPAPIVRRICREALREADNG